MTSETAYGPARRAVPIAGRPWRTTLERNGRAYLLLAPSLLFLVVFTYGPIAQALWQSFTLTTFGGKVAGHGLDNYARLFADPSFRQAATNNVVYALATLVPAMVLALALAVGLRDDTRFNAVLRTVFVFPMLLPLVAAAALASFVLMPGVGLLDYHLAKLGVGETNWLGNPDLALASIVGLTIWKNAGYYMLFFLAGLAGIPDDLYDAARLDGAGAWARFTHVTLPLLRPTIAFVFVVGLIYVVSQVDHIVVLTHGGPSDATNIVLNYVFQQAHERRDVARASAATVVSVGALLALSLTSLHALERGVDGRA